VSAVLKDLIAYCQRDLYKPEREHLRRAELEAMTFYNRIRKEAAEEIRHSKKLRDYTDDHMSDCNMAADLIDPESDRE
jgi:predicted RecB family endonuclease